MAVTAAEIVGVAVLGSVPSYTAEVLSEAGWIAEVPVALVSWLTLGAGPASGVATEAATGSLPLIPHLWRNRRIAAGDRASVGAAVAVRARRADARVYGSA